MRMKELLAEHTDPEIERLKLDVREFERAAHLAEQLAEDWRTAAARKRQELAQAAAELAHEVGVELEEDPCL